MSGGKWQRCPPSPSCSFCQTKSSYPWYWGFVDAVYCICLQDADDRFQSSQECFHRCGLCRYVIYYRPKRCKKSLNAALDKGTYGCWESHAVVCNDSLDKKGLVLILEDDVGLLCQDPRVTQDLATAICTLPTFDALYLGGNPMFGLPLSTCARIWRGQVMCTEAYVTTLACRRHLVAEFTEGCRSNYAIDQYLANTTSQLYVNPALFAQRVDLESCIGYSTIHTGMMRFRNGHPLLCAALTLSLIPVIVALIVMLCLYLLILHR